MSAPTTGRWRSLRAGVFALIAAQIAIAGHVIAGGAMPDLTLLMAMSGLLVVSLRGLGRQRASFPALLGVMAGTQVAFHLILSLAGGHPAMVPSDQNTGRMWLFHAVAAVLSTAVLAYGETILFALYGWLDRLVPRVSPAVAVRGLIGWTAIIDHTCVQLRNRLVGTASSVRGPPVRHGRRF